jgi:hypothetical protein
MWFRFTVHPNTPARNCARSETTTELTRALIGGSGRMAAANGVDHQNC